MSDVSFDSCGTRCAGVHLAGDGGAIAGEDDAFAGENEAFVREDDAFVGEDGRRPCVVLAHGFGGTVDSGLMPFAERFAAAGIDALAFDYRHFGASDGEPRQLLSIPGQLEDYAAAIAFARTIEGVDPDRIVVWGSSFSGGHVVPVAVADGRVAAVIAQVPSMDNAAALANVARYAGPGALVGLVTAALRDVLSSLRGGVPVTIPLVGPPGSVGAMTTADAEPGYRAIAGSTWRNEAAARIALRIATYRPGRQADRLPCPILVQIADHDTIAPPKAAEDAAWLATGRAEVRTYPIGHFDIYLGEPFERAVAHQLLFLRRHVGAPAHARSHAHTHAPA